LRNCCEVAIAPRYTRAEPTGLARARFTRSLRQITPFVTQKRVNIGCRTVRNCQEKVDRAPIVIKAGNVSVKIYRVSSRGYDSFIVIYYSAGNRRRESLSNLSRAKERANEIARAIINDRLAVVELSSADRDGYVKAVGLLRPFGIPLRSAIEEYVEARSRRNGPPLLPALQEHIGRRHNVTDKPVREIVDELIESKRHALRSRRYIQTLRSHLIRFAIAFQTNIGSITTGMIEDWLVSSKLGPCGRNNVRCSLVTFFHFARSRSYLPKGEATEADDIPKVKDRDGKIGRPQELAKLLSEADAEAALYLAHGAFTGMRSAELIRLEWSDINLERGYIVVAKEKAKTATRRLVPIQPNLMKWLAPHRARADRVFVSEHAAARTIAFAKKHVIWPPNALRHS
jgi:integrase-like protein